MFSNDFIDFCNLNYDELVKLSQQNLEELTLKYFSDYAKMFVNFRSSLQREKKIPITKFIDDGIDFQSLCLLVFLVCFNEGSNRITMDRENIIYNG